MSKSLFKVVPLCDRQLRDVSKSDILNGGLYRKCDVYRGGGGYDKFSSICKKRIGYEYSKQFVVQLYGCPLRCPYCYVTQDGIFGEYVEIGAEGMLDAFVASGQDIFHLMGGAPALYMDDWSELITGLGKDKVFHSDFLLVEGAYKDETLRAIRKDNTLYAVSIKGYGLDFKARTGVTLNTELFWSNLLRLVDVGVNFYMTFTDMTQDAISDFKRLCTQRGLPERIFDDSFSIDLISYKALE